MSGEEKNLAQEQMYRAWQAETVGGPREEGRYITLGERVSVVKVNIYRGPGEAKHPPTLDREELLGRLSSLLCLANVYIKIKHHLDCFCIHSASLCLLIRASNPLTFKVIMDMYDKPLCNPSLGIDHDGR